MEENQGFGFKKVAKTGNIGKKSPVAGDTDYVRYLSMQKVNTCFILTSLPCHYRVTDEALLAETT